MRLVTGVYFRDETREKDHYRTIPGWIIAYSSSAWGLMGLVICSTTRGESDGWLNERSVAYGYRLVLKPNWLLWVGVMLCLF